MAQAIKKHFYTNMSRADICFWSAMAIFWVIATMVLFQ